MRAHAAIVEEKKPEEKDEVVKEGVVRSEDDADLPRGHDEEADEAKTAREEEHPDDADFHDERGAGGGDVKPVRQVLDVVANPGGQRTILVVLVHGGEVPPLGVAGEQLNDAGFKVDPEPLP